jgi:signal transduction histidine kinase
MNLKPWFDRFWSIAGAVGVRTKILGIVLVLVLLLGLGVTLQVRATLAHVMTENLREQSVSIARDVAARSVDPILINDLYTLQQLLRDTQANNPDVRYAFVLDANQHVLASTYEGGFPLDLIGANTATPEEHHRLTPLTTEEGAVWDTAVPIFEGRAGIARVGLSESRVQAALATVTTQLLLTTVVISAIGVLAATFLTVVLTRPIVALVRATQAIGRGDFTPRIRRWADDEIGELSDAFNAMTEDLARAAQEREEREQMRTHYLSQIIAAQEDERKRIARELHDETGQALASLMVGLRNVEEAPTNEEMRRRLSDLRRVAANTLEDVRALSVDLRPSVLDDHGLVAALARYTQDYVARHHLPVDYQTLGLDGERLPPPIETAVYRIVQEALTNIAKYAGPCRVSVLLKKRTDQISAIVEDTGGGFDVESVLSRAAPDRRLGLYGMRERAALLGGAVTIESQPGHGATVYVRIPMTDDRRRMTNDE